MAKLTLNDLRTALDKRINIAHGESEKWGVIVLDYYPLGNKFLIYQEGDVDNVYSAFGAQLAIDRYNELVSAR